MDGLFSVDLIWIEIILIFLGITLFIIALFKPKDNTQQLEEKVERLFDEFITQIDVDNDEMLRRMKQLQVDTPTHLNERLAKIEQRLDLLELAKNEQRPENIIDEQRPESIINEQRPRNNKYDIIINLYQNGEDIDSIAKKMQMGHAEIKLILELSKKGFNYA